MKAKISQTSIDPDAYVMYEVLAKSGRPHDPQALVKQIQRLQRGLPAEDEFSMILSWLGKCRLVHKLDQFRSPPKAKQYYRVPDLLAIFDYNEHQVAALIEVKSIIANKLSWKPEYFEGLRNYGQTIGLPILIAWKCNPLGTPLGVWALFDLRHFERSNKKYVIAFEAAMKENLMGLLAGDFAYTLRRGVGIHLNIRKIGKLSEHRKGNTTEEKWEIKIEDAFFTNGEGERVAPPQIGMLPLFISALPIEEQAPNDGMHHRMSWMIPSEDNIVFAHRALPLLLMWDSTENNTPRWRDVLQNYRIPIDCQSLREAAESGIPQKIVRYVLDLMPHIKPDFLQN